MKYHGFKVKDTKTGLFSAGIIGTHWKKGGRVWASRSAFGSSIAVYKSHSKQKWYRQTSDPADWVVVALTDVGEMEFSFNVWVASVGTGKYPVPMTAPGTFTVTTEEIDMVEEAMRDQIGDSDAAGELAQRVVAILKKFEANTL